MQARSNSVAIEVSNHPMWRVTRVAATLLLPLALSACMVAPGMRMTEPAAITVSTGDANQPASSVTLPIKDIDVALLQQQKLTRNSGSTVKLDKLTVTPRDYTIGPGDVLQITVWDHPELTAGTGSQGSNSRASDPASGFVVNQRGNIQFPYAGRLHVANLRPEEAEDLLYKQLSKAYKDPQVTLRVASFRAKSVYVEGEVKAPGLLPLNDIPMTLLEAVNRAGGFSSDADQGHLTLVRDGASYPISLTDLLDNSINPASILLQPGDLLRVPGREDNGVFVMGEVTKPAIAIPMKTGRLTISQALAQAGSINSNTADAKELYVVRGMATDKPEVFHLNAHSPVAMTLANEFQLLPNDVVYVDGNGLVRFSRVLSLLLPSYNAGMAAALMAR